MHIVACHFRVQPKMLGVWVRLIGDDMQEAVGLLNRRSRFDKFQMALRWTSSLYLRHREFRFEKQRACPSGKVKGWHCCYWRL